LKKSYKCLLILLSILFMFPILTDTRPARALSTYTSRPTAHVVTNTVTDPTYAYDTSLTSYARFRFDDTLANALEVKTFTTTTGGVYSVTLKLHYKADAGGSASERYRISYFVDPSPTRIVLVDWTSSAHALSTVSWTSPTEPNDGAWSFTDIQNTRFICEGSAYKAGGASYFDEYEVWFDLVYYQAATISVDPATQSIGSYSVFTANIKVTNAYELYGWEAEFFYNTTVLTALKAVEGAFLKGGGSTYFHIIDMTDYNATHGRVYLTCTLLTDTAGVTGTGVLATIHFVPDYGLATGVLSFLRPRGTKLIGYDFTQKIAYRQAHTVTDGTATVTFNYQPTLSVEPATQTISSSLPPLPRFTVDIKITGVYNLYGVYFRLGYNTTVFTALNITEGAFVKSGGTTIWTPTVSDAEAYVSGNTTLTGDVQAVNGTGIVATIIFTIDNGPNPSRTFDLSASVVTIYSYTYKQKYTIYHPETDGAATVTSTYQPTIYVDPPTKSVGTSSTFTMNLNITGVYNLYKWDIVLFFDKTLLNITAVTEGAFLQSGGTTTFSYTALGDANRAGKLSATCILVGDVAAVNGSGVIMTITFITGTKTGTTDLSFAVWGSADATRLTIYSYTYKIPSAPGYLIYHKSQKGTVTVTTAVPEFSLGFILELSLIAAVVYIAWKKHKLTIKHSTTQATPNLP